MKYCSLLILIWLWLLSCAPPNTSEYIAEEFVGRYYVQINQAYALEITSGFAREKLIEELDLVRSVREAGADPLDSRPHIEYELTTTKRVSDDNIMFIYKLIIQSGVEKPLAQSVLINTSLIDDRWKVVDYRNFSGE